MTTYNYNAIYLEVNRLAVKREFPWFKYWPVEGGGGMFTGTVKGSNDSSGCEIRVVCSGSFPLTMPDVSICSPKTLLNYWGESIGGIGTSHSYHTLGLNRWGELRLCHASSWQPDNTLLEPISKAFLWWNAYKHHRKTGDSIDDYFKAKC